MLLKDVVSRLHGTKELPAMPATGQKLLRMAADPDFSMQEIAAAVSTDPPLAAGVLRLANSAAYGFRERTTDLGSAITRIGLRMLKTLVVASSVLRSVSLTGNSAGFDRRKYWRYCLAVAIGARMVAWEKRPELADDAFLAGLLHGIGLTILDVFWPELLAATLDSVKTSQMPLPSAVRKHTGLGLGEIGAVLLEEWEIDSSVCRTIAALDGPDDALSADERQNAAFVRIGLDLARQADLGSPLDRKLDQAQWSREHGPDWAAGERALEQALADLGAGPEKVASWTARVKDDFAAFEGLAHTGP